MPAVGKDAFRTPAAPKMDRVPVAELGADAYVCVRAITPKDLRELRTERGESPELGNLAFTYDLLARSLCDDAGARLFADAGDVAENFGLSVAALNVLAEMALKASGIGTTEKN